MQPKYIVQKIKKTDILVTKWNSLYQREKSLWGSQTQEIHYSEEIAGYKAVVLTYPQAVVVPLTLSCTYTWVPPNETSCLKGSSMDFFRLEFLPKLDLQRLIKLHTITLRELANITISA